MTKSDTPDRFIVPNTDGTYSLIATDHLYTGTLEECRDLHETIPVRDPQPPPL